MQWLLFLVSGSILYSHRACNVLLQELSSESTLFVLTHRGFTAHLCERLNKREGIRLPAEKKSPLIKTAMQNDNFEIIVAARVKAQVNINFRPLALVLSCFYILEPFFNVDLSVFRLSCYLYSMCCEVNCTLHYRFCY